jgi:transcriptional regulator with XRE-family HTH domain
MKLHEKIKYLRELKHLSQENIAFEIGINQSQYSRRENGNIKLTFDEICKLSIVLEVSIIDLLIDDLTCFNINENKKYFSQNINFPAELIEQFELRLKEKDELIKSLKETIEILKKTVINHLQFNK